MNELKTAMITVKVTPLRLEEFRIAALLRGATMSALISQFVTQVVREEKIAVPEAFKRGIANPPPDDDDDADISDLHTCN